MGAPQGPHGMERAGDHQHTQATSLAFFPKITPLEHSPHGKTAPLPWQSTLLNTVTKPSSNKSPLVQPDLRDVAAPRPIPVAAESPAPGLSGCPPAQGCRQAPQQRCHSGLVERCPGLLPLPAAAPMSCSRERGRAALRDANRRWTKAEGWHTTLSPVFSPGPRMGPVRRTDRWTDGRVAAGPVLSHRLLPARGFPRGSTLRGAAMMPR